jgi:DNA-binding LacI/PurR family transcriptional regulator
MMTRSHWWQVAHAKAMESSYQVISLLFNKMNGDLPDALIIADDNLVEGATQALADSGAQDVKVMAHCNFPLPAPAGYPVERVGFDARELLRVCIQTMAAHNAGEPMPEEVLIPARLEEELT